MNGLNVTEMFFIDQKITLYNMSIILPYKLKTSKIVYNPVHTTYPDNNMGQKYFFTPLVVSISFINYLSILE